MSSAFFQSPSVAAYVEGLALCAGLIVALGPQNLFVLREGARRRHVVTAIASCTLSDACLVILGVLGFGTLMTSVPSLATVLRGAGVAFLLYYAARSVRAAMQPVTEVSLVGAAPGGGSRVVTEALGYSVLNPHALLDTVVLLGGAATRYGSSGRLCFALGAITVSCVWFSLLGFGAAAMGPWLTRPAVQRGLDLFSAAVMLWVAIGLVRG